ncbi:MAG: UvrD-helicase domain-containing protein, partial [Gammaproteobacteria bacterium]|nr:UvrD-helicase domain-containing protein [Gammaproteobacteria bacterium]
MSLAIELNSEQKQVVCAPFGHQLVLAGAGSGKTRVLVHRIAWIVGECNVSPYNVMAVTFTNKAASELRSRVESTLSGQLKGIMLGTFHGLCHQLLRQYAEKVNLPTTFQVMDSDDQQRLIKKIHKEYGLDEDKWPAKKTQSFINQQKEQGRRAKDIGVERNPFTAQMITVYKRYEDMCETSALVDFTELLLRTYELLRDDDELRLHYQTRLSHILVDEFQDTNALQYAWLKLFVGENTNIMVVGDDDQSIYSWRGARVENIFAFEKDFPNVLVSRLEQNYRSTGNILGAANEVIHYNTNRMGKKLWTESN